MFWVVSLRTSMSMFCRVTKLSNSSTDPNQLQMLVPKSSRSHSIGPPLSSICPRMQQWQTVLANVNSASWRFNVTMPLRQTRMGQATAQVVMKTRRKRVTLPPGIPENTRSVLTTKVIAMTFQKVAGPRMVGLITSLPWAW